MNARATRRFATALVALSACSGSQSGHNASSPPPPRLPALDVIAHTIVVPPLGPPRLLYRDEDDRLYFAVGGVRVRAHGSTVDVADQSFASTLVAAAPSHGGWIFLAESGSVALADDFLATVHFETSLGQTVRRAVPWRSGIAAQLEHGDYAGAGAGRPSPNVFANYRPPAAADAAMLDRVMHAAIEHQPLARITLQSTALLANGQVALRTGDSLYFAEVGVDGQLSASARIPLQGDAAGDCALDAWGSRAILSCGTGTVAPFLVDATTNERIGPRAQGPILVGREGHTLTFRGPCPDPPDAASGGPSPPPRAPASMYGCTLDRDRDWREWEYPDTGRLIDVYDGLALFANNRNGIVGLVSYEIDLAHATRIRLSDPSAEVTRAGFTPDGRVIVLAAAGTGSTRHSLLAIGAPDEPLTLRPLGIFANDVAMADEHHGLAVGTNARDVAESEDGGANWTRVPDVVLDGDPEAVALPSPDDDPGANVRRIATWVQCSPTLCRAGRRIVHRWGEGIRMIPSIE